MYIDLQALDYILGYVQLESEHLKQLHEMFRFTNEGDGHVIYFVQEHNNGWIKIGTTGQFPKRLSQLRREHGELELLGLIPGSYEREQSMHNRFSAFRIGYSEWFYPDERLMNFIQEDTHKNLPSLAQIIHTYIETRQHEVYRATPSDAVKRATEFREIIDEIEQLRNENAAQKGQIGGLEVMNKLLAEQNDRLIQELELYQKARLMSEAGL